MRSLDKEDAILDSFEGMLDLFRQRLLCAWFFDAAA